jgi:hypothetical protein
MLSFPPDMFQEEEGDNGCHELANDRISLDTGMSAFVKWFELEQGEWFVLNDMEGNDTNATAIINIDSIATPRLDIEGDNDDSSSISVNGNQHLNHICFVTSLFVEDDNYTGHDGKDSYNSPKNNTVMIMNEARASIKILMIEARPSRERGICLHKYNSD